MVKKIIFNLDEYLMILMLAVSTALIFAQVVMRYIFGYSLSWSEELARYMFVWQTWVSTGYAVKKRRHIRITSFVDMARGANRALAELVVLAVWFAFSVFLGYKSAELCEMLYAQGQTSTAMGLPMWIAYLSVPIGAIIMAYQIVREFFRFLGDFRLNRG
ncbi:MAG: TRAP transporter small permease [Synergistaceae bacterium]|jgi:TRAP-type C4-dicarboxylate transport system permease small subunit|nr:TRAP transporter small permease [Synergistaceae bacterium]